MFPVQPVMSAMTATTDSGPRGCGDARSIHLRYIDNHGELVCTGPNRARAEGVLVAPRDIVDRLDRVGPESRYVLRMITMIQADDPDLDPTRPNPHELLRRGRNGASSSSS
jgi:hypothetical protein